MTTATDNATTTGFDLISEMAKVDLSTPMPKLKPAKSGDNVLGTMSESVKRVLILAYLTGEKRDSLHDEAKLSHEAHIQEHHRNGVPDDESLCEAHRAEVEPKLKEVEVLRMKFRRLQNIAHFMTRIEHPEWDKFDISFRAGGVIIGRSQEEQVMNELNGLFSLLGIDPVSMSTEGDGFEMKGPFPEE